MSKHIRKIGFVTGALAVLFGVLVSCTNAEELARLEKEDKERQEQLAKEAEEKFINEKNAFQQRTKDSLLEEFGYDKAKYYFDSKYNMESEIGRLKALTQADIMAEKIEKANEEATIQIKIKSAKALFDEAEKYGLSVSIENLGDYDNAFAVYSEFARKGRDLSELPIRSIKEYGAQRQNEISEKLKIILDKMDEEIARAIQENEIRISKSFSDYYPILDLGKLPKEYAAYFKDVNPFEMDAEGEAVTEYRAVGWQKALYVSKYVRVYDSNLPVDFFGEQGAIYKLNQISKGKWQVVKTSKNGKVSKTFVFNDNADYKIETGVSSNNDDYRGKSYFEFKPGKNIGVEIIVREVLYKKTPNKTDDKYPDPDGKIAAKIKLLQEELDQKLKEQEQHLLGWTAKRELSKINYHIHTDAVKHNLIPPELTASQISAVYANEADVLNMALFGMTAKQWRDKNPALKGNIRDYATINELICLSNLENINAVLINDRISQKERLVKLNKIAIQQMGILQEVEGRKLLK